MLFRLLGVGVFKSDFLNIKWLVLVASFVGSSFTFAESNEYKHLLRDKSAECGFYLARLNSEFTGKKIVNGLDTEDLKKLGRIFNLTEINEMFGVTLSSNLEAYEYFINKFENK